MTANTSEILDVVESLPIEMRLEIIDRLLESVSPKNREADEAWKAEVERRIDEAESGEVNMLPGDEVFARLRARYKK